MVQIPVGQRLLFVPNHYQRLQKSGPVLGACATAGGRPGGRPAISASCAASTSVPTDPPIYVLSEESGCYDSLQYLFSICNTKTRWTPSSSKKNIRLSWFSKKKPLYGHLRILRWAKCPHEPDLYLDFNSGDRIESSSCVIINGLLACYELCE